MSCRKWFLFVTRFVAAFFFCFFSLDSVVMANNNETAAASLSKPAPLSFGGPLGSQPVQPLNIRLNLVLEQLQNRRAFRDECARRHGISLPSKMARWKTRSLPLVSQGSSYISPTVSTRFIDPSYSSNTLATSPGEIPDLPYGKRLEQILLRMTAKRKSRLSEATKYNLVLPSTTDDPFSRNAPVPTAELGAAEQQARPASPATVALPTTDQSSLPNPGMELPINEPPPVPSKQKFPEPPPSTPETKPNMKGGWGYFQTDSAYFPRHPRTGIGVGYQYENYRSLHGTPGTIDGWQTILPLFLTYANHRFSAGIIVPYQQWEVRSPTTSRPPVNLSWYHDPEVSIAVRAWKAKSGNQAFAFKLTGRASGDAYHQPLSFFEGKSRIGERIGPQNVGPAGATRGSWWEFGGIYSHHDGSRWEKHLNVTWGRNVRDEITRWVSRATVAYKAREHISLIGQLTYEDWKTGRSPGGANTDMLVGMSHHRSNVRTQIGFPIHITRRFGYGYEPVGVQLGVSTEWE